MSNGAVKVWTKDTREEMMKKDLSTALYDRPDQLY
jgi:hypothetical protein